VLPLRRWARTRLILRLIESGEIFRNTQPTAAALFARPRHDECAPQVVLESSNRTDAHRWHTANHHPNGAFALGDFPIFTAG
jgi:hypothetical protein